MKTAFGSLASSDQTFICVQTHIMTMKIGTVVKDEDPSYGDGVGVVVRNIDTPSDEVMIESEGKTVSELNPKSDPNSDVVEMVFKTKLDYNIPDWWLQNKETLQQKVEELDIKSYKYPTDKLSKVRDGLVDGAKVTVVGVSDPLGYKKGAYNFRVENSDVDYSQSSMVFDYSKVTTTISYLRGMIDALTWIENNKSVNAVQFIVEDASIEQKLDGNATVKNEDEISLIHEFNKMTEGMDKVQFRTVRRSDIDDIASSAVEKYKQSESDGEDQKFEVDKVVNNEFLVDGVYSVNLKQQTCTCSEVGECEHIEYVRDTKSINSR